MTHNKLMCDVQSISYNFDTKIGTVQIGYGCTDMSGTIDLFTKIDPEVRGVYTFSTGLRQDTFYTRTKSGWQSSEPEVTDWQRLQVHCDECDRKYNGDEETECTFCGTARDRE